MPKARYIMIGGFLGAGKTTAVLKLAEHLAAQGLKVGLITNDQSVNLVDTAMLGAHGFPVEEITGGCFCCKFNSLVDAATALSKETRPDVFIAEPVGSCTDLKATVSYPLRRIYGDDFTVAPLTVLVDPIRALRVLGVEEGKAFSPKVVYVYLKQLEEAEVIVINKVDLISADRLAKLREAIEARAPRATIVSASARHGAGLNDWFDLLARGELASGASMEIDYDEYAEGEALLGWLNATIRVESDDPFDGNAVLPFLAREIQYRLGREGVEIAHLKMTLTPAEGNDLAVLNLVRSDGSPERSHSLQEELEAGELIVNLRAEGDPDVLRGVLGEALSAFAQGHSGIGMNLDHVEHFRPGRPNPTHRMIVP